MHTSAALFTVLSTLLMFASAAPTVDPTQAKATVVDVTQPDINQTDVSRAESDVAKVDVAKAGVGVDVVCQGVVCKDILDDLYVAVINILQDELPADTATDTLNQGTVLTLVRQYFTRARVDLFLEAGHENGRCERILEGLQMDIESALTGNLTAGTTTDTVTADIRESFRAAKLLADRCNIVTTL
jgi:hypothetical protein